MNYNPRTPIAVFLGPSLDQSAAAQLLAANYYPPARMGDIYRLLGAGVRLIVLIDGLFHQTASVWQRELLEALDNGISVIGASSMGALRAAELHPYGMLGCGVVFEWYRAGLIEGDDEVALYHAGVELGYRPLSEPLVNIRYTLGQAVRQGYLAPDQAAALVEVAKSIYYADRSYAALLKSKVVTAWPLPAQERLARFFRQEAINLKRQDALGALGYAARLARGEIRPPIPARPLKPSNPYYHRIGSLRRGFLHPGGTLVSGETLLAEAATETGLVKSMEPELVKNFFLLLWAGQKELACPPEDLARFRDRWLERYVQPGQLSTVNSQLPRIKDRWLERYVQPPAESASDPPPQPASSGGRRSVVGGLSVWLQANGLTEREFEAGLAQRALLAWLVEQGPGAFGLDFGPYEQFVKAVNWPGGWRLPFVFDPGRNSTTPPGVTQADPDFSAGAAEICFLAAWAGENGVACPPDWLEKFVEQWDKIFLRPGAGYRSALAGWATAAWLVERGPAYFGYHSWSVEMALLEELQLTGEAGRIVNCQWSMVNGQ